MYDVEEETLMADAELEEGDRVVLPTPLGVEAHHETMEPLLVDAENSKDPGLHRVAFHSDGCMDHLVGTERDVSGEGPKGGENS